VEIPWKEAEYYLTGCFEGSTPRFGLPSPKPGSFGPTTWLTPWWDVAPSMETEERGGARFFRETVTFRTDGRVRLHIAPPVKKTNPENESTLAERARTGMKVPFAADLK